MKKTSLVLLLAFMLTGLVLAQEAEDQFDNPLPETAVEAPVFVGSEPSAGAFTVEAPRIGLRAGTESPWATLDFGWDFSLPLLQGDFPLVGDNNLVLTPGIEVSPLSLGLTAAARWTPLAFADLSFDATLASGWSVGDFHGIGLNRDSHEGGTSTAFYDGSPFGGVIWDVAIALALYGDMGMLKPVWDGLPNGVAPIFIRSSHRFAFSGYSDAANRGEAWFRSGDDGENRDGFSYGGDLWLGYRLPVLLNSVALRACGYIFLNAPAGWDRRSMGDDLMRWGFSFVLGFSLLENLDLSLETRFLETRREFRHSDDPGWGNVHFVNRTLKDAGSQRPAFGNVELTATYRFW